MPTPFSSTRVGRSSGIWLTVNARPKQDGGARRTGNAREVKPTATGRNDAWIANRQEVDVGERAGPVSLRNANEPRGTLGEQDVGP